MNGLNENGFNLEGFVSSMHDSNMGESEIRSLSVNIAHKSKWMDRATKEWKEKTHFVYVSFTGPARDRCLATGLSVGDLVMVTGSISTYYSDSRNKHILALQGNYVKYINNQNRYDKAYLEECDAALRQENHSRYFGPRAGNRDESNTAHRGEDDIPF